MRIRSFVALAFLAAEAHAGELAWSKRLLGLVNATSQYFSLPVITYERTAAIFGQEGWNEGKPQYAKWRQGRWSTESASGISLRSDVLSVVGTDGTPRFAYVGLVSGAFYQVGTDGTNYEQIPATVSPGAYSNNRINAFTLDRMDAPHFVINTSLGMTYATRTPGGWVSTLLAESSGTASAALLLVSQGEVWSAFRIFTGSSTSELHFFVQKNGTWTDAVVESPSVSLLKTVLVEDRSTQPHILGIVQDITPNQLLYRYTVRHTWKDGNAWLKENIFQWDGSPAKVNLSGGGGTDAFLRVVVSWGDVPDSRFNYNSTTQCRLLTQTTAGWTVDVCSAPESGVLAMSPAVVDSSGAIHTLYVTQKGEIKYASTRALEDATLLPIVAKKEASLVAANNYFNPTVVGNNYTRLYYKVAQPGRVRVKVYTTDGVLVGTLVDEDKPSAGTFAADWAGKDESGAVVGTGLYVAELEAPGVREVKKIVVVK